MDERLMTYKEWERERQCEIERSIERMKRRRYNGNRLVIPPITYQEGLAELERLKK